MVAFIPSNFVNLSCLDFERLTPRLILAMVVYALVEETTRIRRRDVLNDLPAFFIPTEANVEPLRLPPPAA